MQGGGNDPSCGCDMQAGWPSASVFPRGGIQGGGNWNFNEFNLALTKNGKTRHLRGSWNNNPNGTQPNLPQTPESEPRTPPSPPYPYSNTPETPPYKLQTPPSPKTPKGVKQFVYNNNVYFLQGENVFEKKSNGSKGQRMGTFKRTKNGITIQRNKKKTQNSNNQNEGAPLTKENYNTLEGNLEEMPPRSLASEGGKRARKTRRKTRKHLKRK